MRPLRRKDSLLEADAEPDSHVNAVEERSEQWASGIPDHVAGIEVASEVEELNADANPPSLDGQPSRDAEIERESR